LWSDPDRFDPDRFASSQAGQRHALAMMPFSAGPRKCIGDYFAQLEMQLHLILVARELRMTYGGGEPELDAGVNLRSKGNFMMTPHTRSIVTGHQTAVAS
jgi:cytochrome P450